MISIKQRNLDLLSWSQLNPRRRLKRQWLQQILQVTIVLDSRLQDSELEVDAVWEALKAEEDFTSSCGTIDADISLVPSIQ